MLNHQTTHFQSLSTILLLVLKLCGDSGGSSNSNECKCEEVGRMCWMSVNFCLNLWIIYKLRYHLIEWVSSNFWYFSQNNKKWFQMIEISFVYEHTNETCIDAPTHMECMQSTMHVMYTNKCVSVYALFYTLIQENIWYFHQSNRFVRSFA